MWTRLRRKALLIAGGGVVLGTLGFWWTGQAPSGLGGLPECRATENAWFDPWTGLGHGRVLTCIDAAWDGKSYTSHLVNESPPRAAFGFRRALPLPMGIPLGCIVMGIALRLRDTRRNARVVGRGSPPTPASRP